MLKLPDVQWNRHLNVHRLHRIWWHTISSGKLKAFHQFMNTNCNSVKCHQAILRHQIDIDQIWNGTSWLFRLMIPKVWFLIKPLLRSFIAHYSMRFSCVHSSGPFHSQGYLLTGLQPACVYEAAVSSRNRFGWSDVSNIMRFATAGEGEKFKWRLSLDGENNFSFIFFKFYS